MSMQNQLFLAPFILTILIKYVNQILTNCLYTNNTLFTYAFMNIITKLDFRQNSLKSISFRLAKDREFFCGIICANKNDINTCNRIGKDNF